MPKRSCSWKIVAWGVAVALMAVGALSNAAEPTEHPLQAVETPNGIAIRSADRTLLGYRSVGTPRKPYADQLFTLGGTQILRDSPFDHKQHHALMFAVGVDGVNFWEETPTSGHENHEGFADLGAALRGGLNAATFSERLSWAVPQKEPLLRETRKVTVYTGPDLAATLVTWRSRLEPAAGKREVKLGGSHYFGLGIRFVESMDKVGELSWADASNFQAGKGDDRVTRSAWCAYAAPADGKPVTVALFDHSANARHPAAMFTMRKPFAYLSATLGISKEPLVVARERPLSLCYGVAVWDGTASAAAIQQCYDRWQRLESETPAK